MLFLKKILQYGLILLGIISVLIISLLLIIKIIFPAQELKGIAEKKLEEILKKRVSIEMIQFNPFRGIELKNISISDKDLEFFSVSKLSLSYDFKQLLKRKLIINSISISKPTINLKYIDNKWNIPLLKPDTPLKDDLKPSIIKKAKKPFLPVLPFDIDLQEFNITDLSLSLNYNSKIIAELSGINLLLTGKFSSTALNIDTIITSSQDSAFSFQQTFPENITFRSLINTHLNISSQNLDIVPIKGKVNFNNLSAFYRNRLELKDFSMGLDLILNVAEEKLKLNKIKFDSSNFFNLNIIGEINQLLNQPNFDISLKNSILKLKSVDRYLSAFIPDLSIDGRCGINNFHLIGSLQNDSSVDAKVQGSFFWDNINADYLKKDISLKNAGGRMVLKNLNFKNNIPNKIDGKVNFHFDKFISKTVSLYDLQKDIHFFTPEESPDEQWVNFNLKLNEIKLNIEDGVSINFPFKAHGSLISNIADLDVKRLFAEWNLAEGAAGKITATYLTSHNNKFTVNNTINLNIAKIKKYIPYPITKDLNLSGKVSSNINLAGQLNKQYLPDTIGFKVRTNLENLNVNYLPYKVVISGFNAKALVQGKIIKTNGIELPVLKFDGGFSKIKYSDNINIWESTYSFAVQNNLLFNLKKPFGTKVNIAGNFKSKLAEVLPQKTKLKQLKLDLAFSAITSEEKILDKIKLSGNIFTKNFQVNKEILSNNIKISFDADSPFLRFSKPRLNINLSTGGIKVFYKDWINLTKNISGHILFLPNFEKKSIVVKKMDINGLPLFRASLKKGMFNIEKQFDFQEFNFFLDTKHSWESIPNFLRNEIPIQNATGSIHISANAKGKMPSKSNISKLKFPLKFNSKLNLDKVTLELKHPDLRIKKLDSQTSIGFDSNVISLNGITTISSISSNSKTTLPELSKIYYQYNYSLKDFNTLNINKSIFTIEKGLFTQHSEGEIDGLNFLFAYDSPFSALEMLKRIKLNLATTFSIKGGEKISFTSPIRFTGELDTNVFIKLIPDEVLSINGNLGFRNFNLEKDTFLVKNMTGNIPINKSYFFINKNSIKPIKPLHKIISQSGFFSDLRNYSKHKDLISIESIQAAKQNLKQILVDLYLKDNLFAVEQFSFELEGGSVLGNLFLLPKKKGHKLFLKANFANIDLKRIFKTKSSNENVGDSNVNGNTEFIINISYGPEASDFNLGQIEMDLNITHIGERAFEQILIFLDPKESNPSIANLKGKLKLAKPSHINISLKNERLSMNVQLKTPFTESGFLNMNVLNRIPIQRIKQFALIKENLKNIAPFLKILTLWASNNIALNEKKFIFR